MANMRTAGKATSDLEKASLKVQDAFMAEEDAAGRVRVAEARLTEVRESGKATASQLAQAEEQLASAVRSHEQARQRAIVVGQDYIDQQKATAAASDDAADSVKKYASAADKVARRANTRFKILASTVGTALPAATSAAVGALTGGAALGFVALGAVGVRESERVLAAWESTGNGLSDKLAEDAAVLEDSYISAAQQIGATYDRLRPQLRDAFAASVPAVEQLTDGVTGFAVNAMPGLVTAVERSEPVFEGLRRTLEQTGTSTSDFMREISEYSDEAGEGFEHLGTLIDEVLSGTAPILGHLTALWAEHGDQFARVVGSMLDTLGNLTGGALPAFSGAVGSALTILESILSVIEPMASVLGPAVGAWLSLASAMKIAGAARGAIASLSTRVGDLAEKSRKMSKGALAARGSMAAAAVAAYAFFDAAGSLNPEIDRAADGLERFAETGKASGEAARVFGGDLGLLRDAIGTVTDGGISKAAEEVTQFVGDLVGVESNLGLAEDRLKAFDDALSSMVQSGDISGAWDALKAGAEAAGVSIEDLKALLPGYSSALDDVTGGYRDMSAATSEATEALNTYLEAQRAATDPVFALGQAVRAVDEAQRNYNKAVKEYGENSPQAREASWALAEAVSGAEQAALNGDISFSEFETRLQAWVAQGAITAAQADDIRERVARLRGEAEDYRGNYSADVHARTAGARRALGGIIRMINGIPRTVTTTHNVVTHYSSTGNRIGTQNSAGEWYQSTPGYADGGLVGFPTGGRVIGPGGPREDAIVAALSNGEFVVNARATQDNLELLQAINSGRVTSAGAYRDVSGNAVRSAPIGAAGGRSVTVVLNAPNYVGSKSDLMQALRKEVSTTYGGNIERALGGRNAQ